MKGGEDTSVGVTVSAKYASQWCRWTVDSLFAVSHCVRGQRRKRVSERTKKIYVLLLMMLLLNLRPPQYLQLLRSVEQLMKC